MADRRGRNNPDLIAAAAQAVEARVTYWRQWGIAVEWSPDDRANLQKILVAALRKRDFRRWDSALLKTEAPFRKRLEEIRSAA